MSLAMFAAPFDDNSELNSNNSDNPINQKRRIHSKTYKKYPKEIFDTNKVNSVLEKIHSNLDSDEDDDKFSFNPPPPSKSVGVERTKPLLQKEQMMNMGVNSNNDVMFRTLGRAPQPNYEGSDNLDLNDYNIYGDNKTNEEYYKRVIPGYTQQKNPVNKPYYSTSNYSQPVVQEFASQDVLLQKLNYMITLLEDQQDERTNNVTEEVVLYSFLGIFIIFIADTFVKAGKYVR
jgi:hypothetical protein